MLGDEVLQQLSIGGIKPFLLSLAVILACLIAANSLWTYLKRGGRYPPGPIGLPIVGYLPFILKSPDLHKDFAKLAKKYGPIFSLKLGDVDTVVINDYEGLKEQGRDEAFSDRPPHYFVWNEDIPHMGGMSGDSRKEHRKFLMTTIRNVGMNNLKVEDSLQEQIEVLVEKLGAQPSDVNVDLRDFLAPVSNNIMMSLICGKTFEADDQFHVTLTKCQYDILDYMARIRIASFFPRLCALYEKYSPFLKRVRKELGWLEKVLRTEIEEHEESPEPEKKDYMDFFLSEIKKGNKNFYNSLLLGNSQIISMGGGETIRSTVEWTLLILARHQLIQEMVYREIVEVIGQERLPRYKDKENLILVQALILEAMRYKTVASVTDPHWTSRDTELGGYKIPKGTNILLNLWAVNNDPGYWGDPENFRPERFLSKDFKSIVNSERVVAFGSGKRNCPGEKLAEVELFLIITSLLQKFRFLPPESGHVCLDEVCVFNQMVISPLVRLERR